VDQRFIHLNSFDEALPTDDAVSAGESLHGSLSIHADDALWIQE